MNYYNRHIGDYLKDTAHLSLLEHGVYGRLLDVYYTKESAIADAEAVRLVGARSKEERGALESVLNEFFELCDGMWSHKRCDEEIASFKEKQRKAKASAEKRWAQSERNAEAMRTHTEGNAPSNQYPITNNHSEANASGAAAPPLTRVELWAAGKSALQASGMPKAQCGAFVAKLTKDYGDAVVHEAVVALVGAMPADAPSYLKATCQTLAGQRKPLNRQEAIEAKNRSVVAEWAAGEQEVH